MRETRLGRILSMSIFSLGILLGIVFIAIPVWADLESTLFDPGIQASARLNSLRCPVIITSNETATVSARFKNSLDRDTSYYIRAHITDGYVTLMREETSQIALAPGEAQQVEWPISAEDAAFERLVLFRVTARGGYPLPQRGGTCGVMVLNVPFLTGNLIYALGVVVSLACIAVGGWLWLTHNRRMLGLRVQITRAMTLLAISVVVGLFLGLMGWWLPGVISIVIILLTTGVIIGYVITSSSS